MGGAVVTCQKPQTPEEPWLRRAAAAPGEGLGDMKLHKSRLEQEKEAWARQVSDAPCEGLSAGELASYTASALRCDHMAASLGADKAPACRTCIRLDCASNCNLPQQHVAGAQPACLSLPHDEGPAAPSELCEAKEDHCCWGMANISCRGCAIPAD